MVDNKKTFRKSERLYLRKEISDLFSKNESFVCYPFRVLYKIGNTENQDTKPSILISVAKRNFKRANKRNYIKRVTRESYRLNKDEILDFTHTHNLSLQIAYLYIAKEILEYSQIEKAMKKSISSIISQYEANKEATN